MSISNNLTGSNLTNTLTSQPSQIKFHFPTKAGTPLLTNRTSSYHNSNRDIGISIDSQLLKSGLSNSVRER